MEDSFDDWRFKTSPYPFVFDIQSFDIEKLSEYKLKFTSTEKTIADLFKFRNILNLEFAQRFLNYYLNLPSANIPALKEAFKICGVSKFLKGKC